MKIILPIILILSFFIGIKACKENYKDLSPKEKHKYRNKLVDKEAIKNFYFEKPDIIIAADDLFYYNIKHPDIVLKQAIWETGWFKSKACTQKNNIFGFTHDGKNYLTFDSIQDCIIYYKNWQDRNYKGGDYYNFLEKIGYSGDSLYKSHLESIKIDDYKQRIQGLSCDTLQSIK